MFSQESDNLFPVPAGGDERILSEAELSNPSHRLITTFKDSFRHAKDFQESLVQTYLGQFDYGYQVSPEDLRKVGVWRGNVYWEITYRFTENTQELRIEKNTHHSAQTDIDYENLTLSSKRFDEQAPLGSVIYSRTRASENNLPEIEHHEDNLTALKKALQILKDFQGKK